jgi:alkylation response protein AidB-like acyl-CoA dehydrogenase
VSVDLVEAAEGLTELVEAHADKAEQGRRLPKRLVQALRDAQLMRMCVPLEYGGPEADPVTMVRAIETLAAADGAAAWCAMIASTTSSMSLFMDPEYGKSMYGDPKTITGGAFAPNGKAQSVDGGWRVSGRWQWGSGSQHCQWILGGTVTDSDEFHLMFFDAEDVTIHDTWYSSGLRGTGSHDFSVDGAFVPRGRSVQPFSGHRQVDCPLALFPNFTLLAACVSSVSLGIARHALDEIAELGQQKKPMLSSSTISQSGWAQAELAKAEALVCAAQSFLHHELAAAWDTTLTGSRPDVAQRARIRLAGVNAADASSRAVDIAYTLGGGTSVYETSVLQRCLRDAHVATQHMQVSPRLYSTIGQHLFGQEIDASTL